MNTTWCLTITLSLLFLIGCTSISNPSLERIEDVEIVELSKSKVALNVNLVLMNDNAFALDLASADLQFLVDSIEVAAISQTYDTSMPAESEFDMPMYIEMNLDRLYNDNPIVAITKGLKIMQERQLNVQLLGTMYVGKGKAKIKVPINQDELISF